MSAHNPLSPTRKLRDVVFIIGGGLWCLATAIYVTRLAIGSTPVHMILWILGGAILLFGTVLSLREGAKTTFQPLSVNLVRGYRAIAILALNALLLCAGLELTGFALWKVTRSIEQQPIEEPSPREKVSYYSSQSWARRYWSEFGLSRKERYYPYAGWRRAPFKGETINIDQNGIRLTPGADCSANSFKVFAFGESTMWGTGSPDWGTVPAYLQKGLAQIRRGPVCVVNFAESAYVSTQDVIMLLLQLRSGNIPDVVVFYTIGGDIGAAYESGRTGIHANLDQIAARFENRVKSSPLLDWLRSSYSYLLIDAVISKLTSSNPQQTKAGHTDLMGYVMPTPDQPLSYESVGVDVAKLSDGIVRDYFGNYKIVNGLAQKYGFKYFFFLPPLISMGNKPLTREEQEMKNRLESDVGLDKLFTAVYREIERDSSRYPNFYFLNHLFDRYNELIWIDEGHVTPFGNELIARRMLEAIEGRSFDQNSSATGF